MRPKHIRCYQGVCEIDLGARLDRPDEEFDQGHGPLVGLQEVPAAIDNDGGKGLLLLQYVVQGVPHGGEGGGIQGGFRPGWREARRQQEFVGLAQRHVERRGKAHDHVAARLGASKLEETDMTLRTRCRHRQLELGNAASVAPSGESVGKGRRGFHDYLACS